MKGRCVSCGLTLNWTQQTWQYGRAVRAGVPPDQAKKLTPRCQKCMTKALQARAAWFEHSENGGVDADPSPAPR